jgi:hypothetical protein
MTALCAGLVLAPVIVQLLLEIPWATIRLRKIA